MISWMPRTSPTFQSLLRAVGMRVVAGDAGRAHHHRRRHPDVAVEDRAGDLDDRRLRIGPQRLERAGFEGVEVVGLAALERQVGDEAVFHRLAAR